MDAVEIVIRQPGYPDRLVQLRSGETLLGRAEDNDIVLSDVGVSRHHARLDYRNGDVTFHDLGSGNGSFFRGRRIETQPIHHLDEVMIDPFVLTFRMRTPGDEFVDQTVDGSPARLDVVSAPGIFRSYYPIERGGLTIGRADDQDLVLPDPAASRAHCRVEARGNGFVLVDRGSANGVYLNGTRVSDSPLQHGDRIRIGNSEFRFARGEFADAGPATLQARAGGKDTATPLTHSSNQRSSLRVRLVAAIATTLVLGALVLALGLLVLLQVSESRRASRITEASGPPHWIVPGEAPSLSADQLYERGRTAFTDGRTGEAFADFTWMLQKRPGDPSAERLALLTAEAELLAAMARTMAEQADSMEARNAQRSELFADAQRGGRTARLARLTLAAEFRDDPVAQEFMGWKRTPEQKLLLEQLEAANAKLLEGEAQDALEVYETVAASAKHPDTLAKARAGRLGARRALGETVASAWRRGVVAQQTGDAEEARARFLEIKEVDPTNPSVAARTDTSR